jgi:DNA processing protein
LFQEIVANGGALVSEHEIGVEPRRHRFFRRNQLLVAISDAVVVVEAAFRSGARNAALWARRLGKPLFVVPAAPWNPKGGGCIAELKLGARPLFHAKDVLDALALPAATAQDDTSAGAAQLSLPVAQDSDAVDRPDLSGPERSVLAALPAATPRHVDAIAEAVGRNVSEVAAVLLALELRGLVASHPGGGYRRSDLDRNRRPE